MLESLLVSTGVIALAEVGDKTQLLAFLLAARYKKPLPIIAGIFVATLINHALAGALGGWLTSAVDQRILRWVLGLSFVAMGIWTLKPDRIDERDTHVARRFGVFGATTIAFFLAEMGDKTQLATIAMAAHYSAPVTVALATTAGMMIANVPAVYAGEKLASKIPMRLVHLIAAAIFAALGAATLFGAGARFGF